MVILIQFNMIKTQTVFDKVGCIIIFIVIAFAIIGSEMLCMSRWYAYLEFDSKYIKFKRAFYKPRLVNYQYYRFVYIAEYMHKSILPILKMRVMYIVLSSVRLSQYQLSHINNINSSVTTIKVMYTRKNCEYLCSVLNDKQIRSLKKETANRSMS